MPLDPRRTNLPLWPTRFVGRKSDLASLHELLKSHPLVTVLGPPGTGKTRLALEYGLRYLEADPGHEVWFCDLTEAESAEDICAALSRALHVPLTSRGSQSASVAQLATALRARGRMLIILDNFEQVAQHAASTLGVWCSASEARFLVTSRERLRLAGEVLLDLPPLSVPEEGEDAAKSEAVELFLERARDVHRSYIPTDADLELISGLVRDLDGLPLAIELAAARMRVLTPAQIVKNLNRRFSLLTQGPGDDGSRQATLRRAISWSWELLKPWEQAALAQCAVFRGGFSFEAAEEVLELSAYPEASFLLDVLQALVDKSLLFRYEPEDFPGELRFGMYVSIREYAWQTLKRISQVEIQDRHTRYFLRMGGRFSAEADSRGGLEAYRRLSLETENLLAVHRRALFHPRHPEDAPYEPSEEETPASPERVAIALKAALALDPVLYWRGLYEQNQALFDTALDVSIGVSPALRARALLARARILRLRGRMAESLTDCEEALLIAETLDDTWLLSRVLSGFAIHKRLLGQLEDARETFLRALALFREQGDRRHEGIALGNLALLAQDQGNFEEARTLYNQALSIFQDLEDTLSEGWLLGNFAALEEEEGNLEKARRYMEESLTLHREAGVRRAEAEHFGNLALIEQQQGNFRQAHLSFERALRIFREIGDRRSEGIFEGYQGSCYQEEGFLEEARASYERSLAIHSEVQNPFYGGFFLALKGALLASQDNIGEAKEALDAAEERIKALGSPHFADAVGICRGHLFLALSREAQARGEEEEARAHREAAERCLAAFLSPASGGEKSRAVRSTHVRYALRLLEKALSGKDPASLREKAERAAPSPAVSFSAAPPSLSSGSSALVVSASGRWFQPPGGQKVSLSQRRALRLLLKKLAEQRLGAPGEALPLEALLKSGWPDEKIAPEAGKSRVYMALSTLRNLGLREILLRRDDGYLLDPSIEFLVEKEGLGSRR